MQTTRDRLHVGQTSILVFLKRDHVSSLQLRRIVTDHSADVLQASARAGEGRLVVVPREGYQRMQALLPEQARTLEAQLRAWVAER